MSNYEYQTFDNAKMYEIIGDQGLSEDLAEQYIAAVNQPDPHQFLQHQMDQYENASAAGVTDCRWHALWEHADEAKQALESGQLIRVANAFRRLGEAIERLQHPGAEERIALLKSRLEKMERERPLFERNLDIKFLKDCAQYKASDLWANDSGDEIRLTEACHEVWRTLVEIANEYGKVDALPENNASALKDWLRPIAPEYAKKGGRPRKAKK